MLILPADRHVVGCSGRSFSPIALFVVVCFTAISTGLWCRWLELDDRRRIEEQDAQGAIMKRPSTDDGEPSSAGAPSASAGDGSSTFSMEAEPTSEVDSADRCLPPGDVGAVQSDGVTLLTHVGIALPFASGVPTQPEFIRWFPADGPRTTVRPLATARWCTAWMRRWPLVRRGLGHDGDEVVALARPEIETVNANGAGITAYLGTTVPWLHPPVPIGIHPIWVPPELDPMESSLEVRDTKEQGTSQATRADAASPWALMDPPTWFHPVILESRPVWRGPSILGTAGPTASLQDAEIPFAALRASTPRAVTLHCERIESTSLPLAVSARLDGRASVVTRIEFTFDVTDRAGTRARVVIRGYLDNSQARAGDPGRNGARQLR